MFTSLTEKAVNYLIYKNVIDNDNLEIYQYGLGQIFSTTLNILTTLLLGIIFGEIYQSLIFVFAFMILRTYSGGYHAKTPIRCYFLTTISIAAGLSAMKFIVINRFIYLGLLILSSLIIITLSPIGTANKPLDEIEKIIYRKKTIIVWSVETCVAIVFIILDITEIHIAITLAQVIISIALIFGNLQCGNLWRNYK